MAIDGKPIVGGSDGTWGTTLNNVLDSLNPTTTTGDIIYATSSSSAGNGVPGRLGVGAANSILTVGSSSALQWSSSMNLSGTASFGSTASFASAAVIGGLLTVNNSVSVNVGTLSVNETAIDTIAEIQATGASATIALHSGLTNIAYNTLVSASDNAIIFYGTASNNGALTIAPWSSTYNTGIRITASNTITLSGSTTFSGGSVNVSGSLNATTLQQGGNAVPTITSAAKMAQGSIAVSTAAGGLVSISTGLTSIANFIVCNGESALSLVAAASSAYSGGTASVVFRYLNTASSGASANGATVSAGVGVRVNWIAFGT